MRNRAWVATLAIATLDLGCSTKCPPEEPCVATAEGLKRAACVSSGTCGTDGHTDQGDLVFDCGSGQCKGAQLCVVETSCGHDPDSNAPGARCVDRPSSCGDPATQCGCTMGTSTFYCCYYAGWKPNSGPICNLRCQ
jgi:hypothetical protein